MDNQARKTRIMFAGGGTGGHLYPAIAMYEHLKEKMENLDVLFVGATGGMESKILPALGVPVVLLPGSGLRGASLVNKVRGALTLFNGVLRGIRTINAYKPDVVVGTGGYASVSIVAAAVLCGKPRILQEQNSVPGLVNRRLARFADLLLLSYEESRHSIPDGVPTAVIGNPLRKMPEKDRAAGARFLGIDPERPTVLVIGGSRGAHSLNVAGTDAAKVLIKDGETQFVFLTGENDFETVSRDFEPNRDRVVVREYLDEMSHAYSVADVAVARAGASSVFELAAFGVPTIFVPYPHAADDHQRLNAEPLRRDGGAVVISDAELSGRRLADELKVLLDDGNRRSAFTRVMTEWAVPDAAERAAGQILDLLKKKPVSGLGWTNTSNTSCCVKG